MFSNRANLFFLAIVSLLLSQEAASQTVHYALNDDGEHEVGVQSTPGEGCTLPLVMVEALARHRSVMSGKVKNPSLSNSLFFLSKWKDGLQAIPTDCSCRS